MNSVGVSRNAGNRTLTREAILTLRPAAAKPDQSTRLHIVSLGCANSRRGCRGGRSRLKLRHGQSPEIPNERNIPVIIGRRINNGTRYLNSRLKSISRTLARLIMLLDESCLLFIYSTLQVWQSHMQYNNLPLMFRPMNGLIL